MRKKNIFSKKSSKKKKEVEEVSIVEEIKEIPVVNTISSYKKFRVWLNKKSSLILYKRSKSPEYLALESGILEIVLDSLILVGSISYLINPSLFTIFLSLGCGSFVIKKVFPSVIQLVSSLNLVRIRA